MNNAVCDGCVGMSVAYACVNNADSAAIWSRLGVAQRVAPNVDNRFAQTVSSEMNSVFTAKHVP